MGRVLYSKFVASFHTVTATLLSTLIGTLRAVLASTNMAATHCIECEKYIQSYADSFSTVLAVFVTLNILPPLITSLLRPNSIPKLSAKTHHHLSHMKKICFIEVVMYITRCYFIAVLLNGVQVNTWRPERVRYLRTLRRINALLLLSTHYK